jgi:hypothetical protein
MRFSIHTPDCGVQKVPLNQSLAHTDASPESVISLGRLTGRGHAVAERGDLPEDACDLDHAIEPLPKTRATGGFEKPYHLSQI